FRRPDSLASCSPHPRRRRIGPRRRAGCCALRLAEGRCNLDVYVVELRVVQISHVVTAQALRQRLHADFLTFFNDPAERLQIDKPLEELDHRLPETFWNAMHGKVWASELPHPTRVEPRQRGTFRLVRG